MKDGQSLERVGVEPDVMLLPTQADFVAGRDPVLAAAAQLAGVSLTPEKAGALFPTIWLTK
jgi:C-terminal processing protease CtpA/Prc